MDPQATLAKLLDALHRGEDDDRDDALEALEDLAEWIKKNGFLPHVGVGKLNNQSQQRCWFLM